METAGHHDASRQPDRVQATSEARNDDVERAIARIHVARAALEAAEVHLQQRDGPLTGHDIAAALCLVNAESFCFQAAELLAEVGGFEVHNRAELGADAERPRRSTYRPAE